MAESKAQTKQSSKFLASAIVLLACAITYFSYELSQLVRSVSEVITFLDKADENLQPVTKEVQEVRKLIPAITKEISLIRSNLPDAIRAVDKAADSVASAATQVEKTRPLVPQILKESEKIRQDIPTHLETIKGVVRDAQLVVVDAKKIGENTTSGFITGIVKAPFNLVSAVGTSVSDLVTGKEVTLNEKDKTAINAAGTEVLNSNDIGFSRPWANPDSKKKGSILLSKIEEGSNCKVLLATFESEEKQFSPKQIRVCRGSDNQWSIKN